jgi:phage shock protein PspC (stress-responsive transcriptional regulator)
MLGKIISTCAIWIVPGLAMYYDIDPIGVMVIACFGVMLTLAVWEQ